MTDDPNDPPDSDNIIRLPPGGHKRKRPGGRTPQGKGNGYIEKPPRGPGYGGPAKGPGQHGPAQLSAPRSALVQAKAERVAAFNDMIFDLAMAGESENIRLQAAIAGLNRLEGAPINKQIVYEADSIKELTDDELREQLEELRRKGTGA